MLRQYYNIETKTLKIPFNFNEELNNLPFNTKIIIFEENYYGGECSKFNEKVDNLPNTITHLTFERCFNQTIVKLPNSLVELGFYSSCKIKTFY